MPIQPLEIYEVEETGELVLKHKYLKEALNSHGAIMIVNHNDKEIVLWIGKGATTRAKFAAARSSRRFLTERSLSYRVRTCDEGDEPDWFQKLFKIKIAKRSRDEPPSLEVLAILNEMKKELVPEGFEREACIISRDFYVPVEHKVSIVGKDTSSIKFEKSSYLPEGFFNLPSYAYRPRLLVRNGKILGLDLLVNYDASARDGINMDLLHEAKGINSKIQAFKQEGKKKDELIADLKAELSEKNKDITKLESNIDGLQQEGGKIDKQIESLQEKDELIQTLQDENAKFTQQIKDLKQKTSDKRYLLKDLQETLSDKDSEIERLRQALGRGKKRFENQQLELVKKDQQIEDLQQNLSKNEKLLERLRQKGAKMENKLEKLERRVIVKDQQIEDLRQNLSKRKQEIEEKISVIDKIYKELREKSERVEELEAE
ncbi:MAG: hypothetical protein HWN65_09125 [Candidatus Helarchaeota archaeon]|nr:hypothetical protein [Candidatus Helarchaeota archaeon]